jgi:hypothetical protein
MWNKRGALSGDGCAVALDRDSAVGELSGFYAERDGDLHLGMEELKRIHHFKEGTSDTYACLMEEGCIMPPAIDIARMLEEHWETKSDPELEAIYGSVQDSLES